MTCTERHKPVVVPIGLLYQCRIDLRSKCWSRQALPRNRKGRFRDFQRHLHVPPIPLHNTQRRPHPYGRKLYCTSCMPHPRPRAAAAAPVTGEAPYFGRIHRQIKKCTRVLMQARLHRLSWSGLSTGRSNNHHGEHGLINCMPSAIGRRLPVQTVRRGTDRRLISWPLVSTTSS